MPRLKQKGEVRKRFNQKGLGIEEIKRKKARFKFWLILKVLD